MKNKLSNKLKVLSSERQDECTKLKESNKLLDNIAEEKEKKLDLDLNKKTGNAEEHTNKVLTISNQYIIKDTNRKFNNIDIISITDNKNQGTTTITTDRKRNNTSSKEGMLKEKFSCEIKLLKSKNESTNTTNYIAKDIVVSNTIKNESELTNSRNNINENEYKDRNIFDKEKNNKHRLKTRMKEIRETSKNTSDSKLDLVEHIKECPKEQQRTITTDNRKNQELLAVPINRKKRQYRGITFHHIRNDRKSSAIRD